jgi:hypothetical protein
MSTTAVAARTDAAAAELALVAGDLSKLSVEQRLAYYKAVCESVGLNPLTRPFDYLTLNNKLVLYAKRDATDQLRKLHGVSVSLTDRQTQEGVYIVTARATDRSGRSDESTGAVTIAGLKGDAYANALMKAETKAKRRVTLSLCGLGMLDETEVETVPAAHDAEPADRQPGSLAGPVPTPSPALLNVRKWSREAKDRSQLKDVAQWCRDHKDEFGPGEYKAFEVEYLSLRATLPEPFHEEAGPAEPGATEPADDGADIPR